MDRLDEWQDFLLTPLRALQGMGGLIVDAPVADAVSHGKPIDEAPVEAGHPFLVCGPEGRLLAVYTATGAGARAEVVLT